MQFNHSEIPVKVKVTQSCTTVCNPMDCGLPGSSVHGILKARILEWVDFTFSRGYSQPKNQIQALPHCRWILYKLSHQVEAQEYWSG